MSELLFEIGAEEIPAGFLARALDDIKTLAAERFAAARLGHGELISHGTPRRLALVVPDLVDRQSDLEEQVSGPPKRAAFDAAGKPTKAAEAFAAKHDVPLESLEIVKTDKGEYVTAKRAEKGRATRDLLPELLGGLLRAIPWKKSMRWAAYEETFVRPVHWIVALFGGEVVPVEFAGIKSGRTTRGHRFMSPGEFTVAGAADWQQRLRAAFVVVDVKSRRIMIEAELERVAGEAKVRVRPDAALLDEVTNLCEYPQGICGSFDEADLEIPADVIVSAMRAHQRYFAMETADGKLANRFATIAGTVTRDAGRVRAGNERVLRARLADARFFFEEDKKLRLEQHAKKLAGVVFQAKLGSVAEKVEALARVAEGLGETLALAPATQAELAVAARLCKADLVSHMVGEFPDLQGVMGAAYARLQGHSDAVASAIVEHYLPRGATDAPPKSDLGSIVGIADRMTTIVGCFGVGLVPSGSADPYALRRSALGILAIILKRGWHVSLQTLTQSAATAYGGKLATMASQGLQAQVLDFFKGRMRGLFIESLKVPGDVVDAVLEASADDAVAAQARCVALGRMRARTDFEPLGVAFKRVANILKGAAPEGSPDVTRFVVPAEKGLWTAFQEVEARVKTKVAAADYDGALADLATLRAPVDQFFADVMVMDKDEAVKRNRLALLGAVNALFLTIADFRQLQL